MKSMFLAIILISFAAMSHAQQRGPAIPSQPAIQCESELGKMYLQAETIFSQKQALQSQLNDVQAESARKDVTIAELKKRCGSACEDKKPEEKK